MHNDNQKKACKAISLISTEPFCLSQKNDKNLYHFLASVDDHGKR